MNPEVKEISLSQLWEQTLKIHDNNSNNDRSEVNENLTALIDQMVNTSRRVVFDSIISRTITQQAIELQKFKKDINNLFGRFLKDSYNTNLMILFVGHLTAQLDFLDLLEDDLEVNADEQLINVVDSYKHANNILCILYNRPKLSQAELARELELSPPALSNALERMKEYRLVRADKHGQKKYYTLSPNGKKVHKYLKLRDNNVTPDRLTVLLDELVINFKRVAEGQMSSVEVMDWFRPLARQCTTMPLELERQMRETLDSIWSINNAGERNRRNTLEQVRHLISTESEGMMSNHNENSHIQITMDNCSLIYIQVEYSMIAIKLQSFMVKFVKTMGLTLNCDMDIYSLLSGLVLNVPNRKNYGQLEGLAY